jgi:predicted ATPase/DNA-binding SARP family transcriptional activator
MAVRIALAGRVEVEVDGAPVVEPALGPLGRLVLAYLVLERRRPVPRDELADVVWGGEPPRSWETSVRVAVSKVRAVLAAAGLPAAEVVTTDAGSYQFHLPDGAVVDVEAAATDLADAVAALATGDPGVARREAAAAADVAGRQLLPGVSGLWAERRQAELRELHVRALEALSEAAAGDGDWAEAVKAAEEAVAVEPFRESAHLRLMAAHRGSGNRGEALRAYERARRLLAEELGVDPSPPMQEAYVALLGDEGAPAPAPRRTAPAPRLPLPLTSFVGRTGAVAEVRRLLASTRLLSLTGTGGMGKTRLALETAAEEAAAGARGVALVELGPLSDADLVPQQVLSALGLSEQPGRTATDTVVDHLCSAPTLLVLDNCEHLLGPAAGFAQRLLQSCPDLRILATTREPLRVPGETTWRIPALTTPDPDERPSVDELATYDAVRLFLDRVEAVRPGLTLGVDDAAALAQVVRRLDGIPLALELAAGRMAVLSVQELAERLDDRFRLLAGGSRTAPDRHQTLRAAVDWTYDALSVPEATLFDRLAVFAGTFTLDAAEAVCAGRTLARGDVLGLLSGLVDKSLVNAEHTGGTTRFRLSETMRRYAQERLAEDAAEDAAQRDAHLAWVAGVAGRAEVELRGHNQVAWLRVVEAALDDVRAALRWGQEQAAPVALGVAAALGRFWEVRGYLSEGRGWLEALLAATGAGAAPEVRAKALRSAGVLAQRQGDYEPARAFHGESLDLARQAGDQRAVAAAVHGLGNLAALQGDLAGARSRYEQSLEIGRALDDDHVVAAALTNLGTVAHNRAEFDEARRLSEESLAVRRRMGDRHGIAMVTGNLAYLAFQQGSRAEARALYEESLALRRELGDRPGIANSLCNLGYLALAEGDLGAATALLEESLALAVELGDKYWTALSLLRLAKVARAEGDHGRASALDGRALTLASELGAKRALAEWLEGMARTAVAQEAFDRAVVLLGAADAVRDELGAPLPPAERPGHEKDLAAARASLGDDAFAAAWEAGRAMPLEEAVRLGPEP